MHVGIANPWRRGKPSQHSRRMRNPQFYVSGKRPVKIFLLEPQGLLFYHIHKTALSNCFITDIFHTWFFIHFVSGMFMGKSLQFASLLDGGLLWSNTNYTTGILNRKQLINCVMPGWSIIAQMPVFLPQGYSLQSWFNCRPSGFVRNTNKLHNTTHINA